MVFANVGSGGIGSAETDEELPLLNESVNLRERLHLSSRPRLARRLTIFSLVSSTSDPAFPHLSDVSRSATISRLALRPEVRRWRSDPDAELEVELVLERLLAWVPVLMDAADTGMTTPCVLSADLENTGVGSAANQLCFSSGALSLLPSLPVAP